MTLADFWSRCLRQLYSELSQQQFNMAIAPLTVGEENGNWVVYAKNQFAVSLLRSQYADKIRQFRRQVAPDAPELIIKVGRGQSYEMAAAEPPPAAQTTATTSKSKKPAAGKSPTSARTAAKPRKTTAKDILAERMSKLRLQPEPHTEAPKPKPAAAQPAAPQAATAIAQAKLREEGEQRHTLTNLSPEYTFDTLVEGKGNHLAAAVAKSIAERPGDAMYNPFFVYGTTGLGKTHLVQAVANRLLHLNPKARVRYMHSDEYLKTFMATVRNKTWDNFKQQYLNYNLLIIDDIQFIQGKDRTMEEFFFLFEHFHSRSQQIILTCDQLPSNLEHMEQRLVSRFSWGMTIKLEPPELEMRIGILERKAMAAGVLLTEEAALFIAQHIKQNVRELEGALNRVLARCRFEKRNMIDIDLANDALHDIVASNHKTINAEVIIKTVADYYRLRISDLLSKKRTRSIARPRQMAMTITKELTNMSLPAVGEAFGGRDHTTVMHAMKTINKLRREDADLNQDYHKLKMLVQS